MALRDTREILQRMARSPSSPATRTRAAANLVWRLSRSGCQLPPQTRVKDKWPTGDAVPVFHRDAALAELLVIRAISMTRGAAQFGISPNGTVFTTDCDGYSYNSGRRHNVTQISDLLDETAGIFNEWQRNGLGGRFYERNGRFFDGESKRIFLQVRVS